MRFLEITAMRNLAVKFAILTSRFQPSAPVQLFLELSATECLEQFKRLIPEQARHYLYFGFTDASFLAVLDQDFEVDMDREVLVFRHTKLDNACIRRANLMPQEVLASVLSPEDEQLLVSLSRWMFDVTRPLYKPDLSEQRIQEIQEEYCDCLKLYVYQQQGTDLSLRSLFNSQETMGGFNNAMTVDAMFKADAAKAIFGEQSSYYQAWLRKEVFRHMITKCVKEYIMGTVAA